MVNAKYMQELYNACEVASVEELLAHNNVAADKGCAVIVYARSIYVTCKDDEKCNVLHFNSIREMCAAWAKLHKMNVTHNMYYVWYDDYMRSKQIKRIVDETMLMDCEF